MRCFVAHHSNRDANLGRNGGVLLLLLLLDDEEEDALLLLSSFALIVFANNNDDVDEPSSDANGLRDEIDVTVLETVVESVDCMDDMFIQL